MKKVSIVLLVCLMVVNMFAFTAYAEETISVLVDGNPISFDVAPYAENGRVMVPVRAIFEALGAEVQWNQETQGVIATKGIDKLELYLGTPERYYKNKIIYSLAGATAVKEGRTFVPLRTVSEAFNCNVSWDGQSSTVSIDTATDLPLEVDYVVESETFQTDNPDVTVTYNYMYPQIIDGKDFVDERNAKKLNEISKDLTYYRVFKCFEYADTFWKDWQVVAYRFPGYPNVTLDIKTELHISEKYNTISFVSRVVDPYIGTIVEARTFDADTCMEYMNVATAVGSSTSAEDDILCDRIFAQYKEDFNGDTNADDVRYDTDINFEIYGCEWWLSDDRLCSAAMQKYLVGVGRIIRYMSTSIVP